MSEVERRAMDALVCRYARVVLKRTDNVQRHFDLEQTLVQEAGRAIRVKSGPCRDDVVLGGTNPAFGPVRVLDVGGDKIPPQLQLFCYAEQGFAPLVVHADLRQYYPMLAEKLHGFFECGGMFAPEAV